MKTLIIISFLTISLFSMAQLPELKLMEINVSDSNSRISEKFLTIKREEILELQPEDVAQLLQKMAGINIKSYGGLGGLKTISVRSLGSQHTSTVVDGFTLNNTQTGQVDLGHVQVDNIEAMYVISGTSKNYLVPSSALLAGSSLFIETFENSFSNQKHKIRFSSKVGSFGQFDNYFAYKINLNRIYVSVFGKYRFADGSYTYSFENGQTEYAGIRKNNKYQDAYGGFSIGWRITEKGILNLNFKSDQSDQELPGAVILYSESTLQTLKTENNRLQLAYLQRLNKMTLRFFSAGTLNELRYHDPSFLNAQGEINSLYHNENIQIGVNGRIDLKDSLNLYFGSEEQLSHLSSANVTFGNPVRMHNFSVLGGKYVHRSFTITSQIASQFVNDSNDSLTKKNTFRMNPFIQLESKEITKKWKVVINTFYRNSMRMPSFNELYYNSIGNNKLIPEDANQLSAGCMFSPNIGKFSILNRSNFYFNQVKNKIVAIPTKNLFIWSMQNVGKVNIIGAESSFDLAYQINKKWSLNSNLNYTLQIAKDITNEGSPTFGHQIAYIPKHTYNADISIKRNSIGIRWSSFGNSMRYSLNENIKFNEVEGFILSDLSVFGKVKIKDHSIRIQLACKNIFNSSYAIVRYYVMPGRNYLISLNYALN